MSATGGLHTTRIHKHFCFWLFAFCSCLNSIKKEEKTVTAESPFKVLEIVHVCVHGYTHTHTHDNQLLLHNWISSSSCRNSGQTAVASCPSQSTSTCPHNPTSLICGRCACLASCGYITLSVSVGIWVGRLCLGCQSWKRSLEVLRLGCPTGKLKKESF